jgi:hypothetical protein
VPTAKPRYVIDKSAGPDFLGKASASARVTPEERSRSRSERGKEKGRVSTEQPLNTSFTSPKPFKTHCYICAALHKSSAGLQLTQWLTLRSSRTPPHVLSHTDLCSLLTLLRPVLVTSPSSPPFRLAEGTFCSDHAHWLRSVAELSETIVYPLIARVGACFDYTHAAGCCLQPPPHMRPSISTARIADTAIC